MLHFSVASDKMLTGYIDPEKTLTKQKGFFISVGENETIISVTKI
jgi:hypothetical protein